MERTYPSPMEQGSATTGPMDQEHLASGRIDPVSANDSVSGVKQEPTRQFAGIVAHSLNNLLTSIIGYANLVQGNIPETHANLRVYAEHILHAADRASRLARDLLAFSRSSAAHVRVLDLNYTVRTVEALLAEVLKHETEFRMQLSPSPLPVLADPAALEQVLINLITNAQDAMPLGGCLTVMTDRAPGNHCVLSVSDTGTGIEPDLMDRIFEPFFTTKDANSGTGLGLAIVANVVEQHKGRLTVSSTLGKGTTFHVTLPLSNRATQEERQTKPVLAIGGNETILVAEDEPAVRNLLALVLRESGYRVIEALDGDAAIRQFTDHKHEIDLAILDIVMPKKNGREVYHELAHASPGLKALFVSGYTKDVVLEKGMIDDRVDFVAKPLVPNELLKRVRQLLDRSG